MDNFHTDAYRGFAPSTMVMDYKAGENYENDDHNNADIYFCEKNINEIKLDLSKQNIITTRDAINDYMKKAFADTTAKLIGDVTKLKDSFAETLEGLDTAPNARKQALILEKVERNVKNHFENTEITPEHYDELRMKCVDHVSKFL